MSYVDYQQSKELSKNDPSFYAIIMAAMRKGDSANLRKLIHSWPQVWDELQRRYNAPGGVLPEEDIPGGKDRRGTKPDRRQRHIIVSNERREEGRDRRQDP